MEKTKKGDKIELKFTGRIKDGEIFDTNIPEQAKKIGLEINVKPFIITIGSDQVISGLDKALEDKEVGKKYEIELTSNQAFGPRRPELVKTVPKRVFTEQEINPQPGMAFNMDGMLVRIISVSGGRILADFNNPLAGKDIVYEFTIIRKIKQEKKEDSAK